MILSKNKIIIFSIFYTGILAGLIGNINIGEMRLQFFFSCSLLFVLIFSIFKWISYKIPYFLIPVMIVCFLMSITVNDKFGFIQFLYMLIPLFSFICGACFRYDFDIFLEVEKVLNLNLRILASVVISSFFVGFSQFDSRPLSIYISLIVLISVILNKSKLNYLFYLILVVFVLLSGARGALFACLISLFMVFLVEKLKSKITMIFSIIMIMGIFVFFEKIIYYIFTIDYLRERTFYDGVYDYSKLVSFQFNSSGRDLTWPIYWDVIINNFDKNQILEILFGHGFGYASQFGLENFGDKWLHPHNEVLRILIDFGIFGIFSILFFWLSVIYLVVKNSGELGRKITIGLASFTFIIMLTDNPLMYPLYYGSICMFLIGLCYQSSLEFRKKK